MKPSLDLDARIDALDDHWSQQGRAEEELYGVRNFLTGSGATEIKQLIRDVVNYVKPERTTYPTPVETAAHLNTIDELEQRAKGIGL